MKTAVITGTSSGLGAGFAKALLELGWKVYGISRKENTALNKHENFRQVVIDLQTPLDKAQLTKTIPDKKIDLLVNNAGMVIMQEAKNFDQKNYETIFSVHYARPLELLDFFYEKLQNGMIITTLTDSTHIGWPRFGLYGASKAALWVHMKSFAAENPGIIVYNVHPSSVDTPIIDAVGQEAISERDEFMTVQQIVTVFVQLVTGTLALNSGASIFLHNEWEAEEMEEIGKDMFIYNVDTESLRQL